MNNKLFARIAAAAISVTMLGTAVFATDAVNPTLTVDGEAATLSFMSGETNLLSEKVAAGADQVTMMSYLVGADATYEACDYADETTTPMIALDQVAANEVMGSVGVLASKLTNAFPKVVVRSGDSLGGGYKWLFERTTTPGGETIVTVMNGTTATNLTADADGYVTLPDATAIKFADNAKFSLYSWVAYTDGTAGDEILLPTTATADSGVIGTDDVVYATVDGVKVVKVKASSLNGKTLYAKFYTGIIIGDVNANGRIDTGDRTYIHQNILAGRNLGNMGKTYAEVAGVAGIICDDSTVAATATVGDVNANGRIDTGDRTYIHQNILAGRNLGKVGKKFYYVNKGE